MFWGFVAGRNVASEQRHVQYSSCGAVLAARQRLKIMASARRYSVDEDGRERRLWCVCVNLQVVHQIWHD
jgi:hypothetical protein